MRRACLVVSKFAAAAITPLLLSTLLVLTTSPALADSAQGDVCSAAGQIYTAAESAAYPGTQTFICDGAHLQYLTVVLYSGAPLFGINQSAPATALDVNGSIRVADGGETCAAAVKGGIRYTSGNILQYCNSTAWQTLGTAGGVALSSITAATTGHTIANANNAQVWNWDTLTTGYGLTLGSSSVTSGSILNISSTNASATGAALNVTTNTTGRNSAIYATISGTGNTGSAISGYDSDTTGSGSGISGATASTVTGNGVYGEQDGAGNNGHAGFFRNVPSDGTGPGIGVMGISFSTQNGSGAVGGEEGTGNTGYGVLGYNASATGYGVYSNGAFAVAPSATTIASATNANFATDTETAPTITLTGSTAITGLMSSYLFNQPTITGASGTITGAASMTIAGAPIKGSVAMTNTYGLKINSGTSVSTATNAYGLYVDAPTGATNNYGAVFNSGNVGIGTATPAAKLDVYGAIDINGGNAISLLGSGATNIAIGTPSVLSSLTSGSYNIAIGPNTLQLNSSGAGNVAVGFKSLQLNTLGQNNVAIGGFATLYNNTAGNYSVAIGYYALGGANSANNTGIGSLTGSAITSGTNNTVLGYGVASTTLSTGSANILIGTSTAVDTPASNTSNFLNIGNVLFATGMTGSLFAPAGNVGIGVTGPATKLDVGGTVKVADGGETCAAGIGGGIRYSGGNLQYCNGTAWTTLSAAGSVAAAGANTQVQFNSGGLLGANANFNWDNVTGRLGIGTTSPTEELTVTGPNDIDSIRLNNAANTNSFGLEYDDRGASADGMAIYSSLYSTEIFTVWNDGEVAIGRTYAHGTATANGDGLIVQGNVGIGSTTPNTNLDVGSGYFEWGGQSRVTADFGVTQSAALTAITGLSATLTAGKTYYFELTLYLTDNATYGVQADLGGGSATATSLIAEGVLMDSTTVKTSTRSASLTTVLCSSTTTSATDLTCHITGTITVNAGGTFIPRFAENTSHVATTATVKQGSIMIVHQIN